MSSEEKIIVYCQDCGAIAGNESKCAIGGSHRMVKGSGIITCRDCAKVPGTPSKCPVGGRHRFVTFD